ncbi:MAG: GTP-binding protein LepA [Actinomycetota bacterium]|nr:GTP-binding protein LepA [Actinomycetota bacterium]
MAQAIDQRLVDHVDRIAHEHPPIDLSSVDFTVRRPRELDARFGHVLDYMARVELEVDKNVLELAILLPDPPDIDVRFFRDVWHPQEIRHGQILDELQRHLERPPAEPDLSMGLKIRILGALGHAGPFQDVSRMLYYLTGMATERSAVLAYNMLYDGVIELGEEGVARTAIGQIKRQEPGHYAFYQLSARAHWGRLARWQKWLVRKMRAISFAPVGAYNPEQSADFGDVMSALGITDDVEDFTQRIALVEQELLFAEHQGLAVPPYVARTFRDAVERAQARADLSAA